MARYRLRLLLQEIDLPLGETVLGRSAEANLTIEDPLVSRIHAKIVIDERGGTIEDLDSRNGVRVNGALIRRPMPLSDGDRLRLGTQDIVFCQVEQATPRANKTTGVLRLCANCKQPYPREMVACPNCEATEQMEEQTLQGEEPSQDKGVWGTQLLVEALERALLHGRTPDAERIARRATAELDAHVAAGGAIDAKTLAALATHAASTSMVTGDPLWAVWSMDAYRRMNRVPSVAVLRVVGDVVAKHPVALRAALARLVDHIRLRGDAASLLTTADQDALVRLDELRRVAERTAPAAVAGAAGVERAELAERPEGEMPDASGPRSEDPDATLDVVAHWPGRS